MLLLRSLLFNVVLFASVLVYAPFVILLFWVPPIPRYRIIRLWTRFNLWWLKITCGLDYRIETRERIPPGPAIILCKHQSSWETLALQLIFPPPVWVLKRELMWIPLFGWALAMTEPIAINRRAGKKAVEQIVEQGVQRLNRGQWIAIFPEGTRIARGQHGRFGVGGAVLASRSGYPVVPVAHNAGSYWPRRGFIKRPGTIRAVIGPAIDSRGRTPEEINQQVEQWIKATMEELERSVDDDRAVA